MTKKRLLSCPFCGVEPTMIEEPGCYEVHCLNMDGCPNHASTGMYSIKEEAIRQWNRRGGKYAKN